MHVRRTRTTNRRVVLFFRNYNRRLRTLRRLLFSLHFDLFQGLQIRRPARSTVGLNQCGIRPFLRARTLRATINQYRFNLKTRIHRMLRGNQTFNRRLAIIRLRHHSVAFKVSHRGIIANNNFLNFIVSAGRLRQRVRFTRRGIQYRQTNLQNRVWLRKGHSE